VIPQNPGEESSSTIAIHEQPGGFYPPEANDQVGNSVPSGRILQGGDTGDAADKRHFHQYLQ
jgi:hypothetical protein